MLALFLICIVLCAQIDNSVTLENVKTKTLKNHHEAVKKVVDTINGRGLLDDICDTLSEQCPEVDEEIPVYIPLTDCSYFCQCSGGIAYLHACPPLLNFNPILNVCDYSECLRSFRGQIRLGSTKDQEGLDSDIESP